ncbi:hypothetical protein ACLED7_01005 [Lonsdalea quercina]
MGNVASSNDDLVPRAMKGFRQSATDSRAAAGNEQRVSRHLHDEFSAPRFITGGR